MTNKQSRHQSVINRHSDEEYSSDHWLKQFENTLQKTSVQPKGQNLFDQISSIMNTKSKYPSVQAAVDDMMQRSGLTSYLQNVKMSSADSNEISNEAPRKTAQQQAPADDKIPKVIKEKPSIQQTLENIIRETRGNMPVPAVISRLHALHARDISDDGAWEDDKLIRLVSRMNLQAKTSNPSNFEQFQGLGRGDQGGQSEIDPSNTDAFNALLPARI